ncbi:beta-1,4-glucuronyltransferase 1-like [Rhopilema esculentum]|uniref:beta-1,4-glucuronyltransferase 1-like n=1 Tax=Rhopilema esculentum TaxID=499914 RepID=UPI0031DE98D5|eukprot:gene12822-3562_t
MRQRNFCYYSLFIIIAVLIFVNLYFFKTSELKARQKEKFPSSILFQNLPSDSTGLYRTWQIFKKILQESSSIDVTIISQTSVQNLFNLQHLVKYWDGPVSVSVFAPGEEISTAIEAIYSLRQCNYAIKRNLDFSLVLALSHPPRHNDLAVYLQKVANHPYVCPVRILSKDSRELINYGNLNVPYPVNLLRNVAIANSVTSHILVIDIDMVPSANLRQHFQRTYPMIQRENGVYVLPTFELREGIADPETKDQLIRLWDLGEARPFYEQVCWKCQKHTDYNRWKKSSSAALSVSYRIEWKDPWEPFFIADRNTAVYDERFKQYGFNRISQVCEMHISGYDFYVLDNAFLIHHGFKEKTLFHKSKDDENAMNRDHFRVFKHELKVKYPESKRQC